MKNAALIPFSFRLLPLLLVAAVVGILAVSIDVWWITLSLSLVLAIPLFVVAIVRKKVMMGLIAIVLLLATAVGVLSVETTVRRSSYYSGKAAVVGRIAEVRSSDGYVEGLVLDSLTIRGDKVSGKCSVTVDLDGYVDGDDDAPYVVGTPLKAGAWVRVWGKVSTVRLNYYKSYPMHQVLDSTFYRQDAEEIYIQSTTPVLYAYEKAQKAILKVLVDRMGWDAGGLSYAMLLGQTGKLTDDVVTGYRSAGIAHLLAVSGLHVGLLVGAVLLLLRLCRCPARWRWLPTLVVWLPYAWLCGWSPSVLRAGTMALTLLVAKSLGRRYDPPSAWAGAALLLLLIKPLWLFDVSFLLSFAAYFGIIVLLPYFRRGFDRLAGLPKLSFLDKVPSFLREALVINLAVTLSVTPLSVYFFGGISWLTIPFNLVFVPLMSLVYTVLFWGTLLGLVWSGLSVVLYPVQWVVLLVNRTMMWVAGGGFLRFRFAVYGIPVYYLGLAFVSPYCRYPAKIKYPLGLGVTAGGILLGVLLGLS